MPKPTFFNLPEEKRRTILQAAIDEFAEYGLENASTNRIVARGGIPKGSFYQYFENKEDVFRYLMTLLEQEKMAFFQEKHPPGSHLDTFAYFRWLIKTGLEFESAYPRLVQAIQRVMLMEGLYYGELFADVRERTRRGLRTLIEQAIQRGELDPQVDTELAIMIMETWSNAINTYLIQEGGDQPDMLEWVRSPAVQERIEKMLYVMEYGLRKTEASSLSAHDPSTRTNPQETL